MPVDKGLTCRAAHQVRSPADRMISAMANLLDLRDRWITRAARI